MGVAENSVEDVLQDVFVAAQQRMPAQADRGEMRRWLFQVAINRCNLEHRRRSRWRAAFHGLTRHRRHSETRAAEDAVGREEERQIVRRAVDRLDPASRSVLVLRYFQGLDSREIARILELPDGTVRSQLRAARKKMALELKREGYGYE
jgi:RNA polymerase sigma-70 factor (ECF subfamily)